jgi:hypothetical protein
MEFDFYTPTKVVQQINTNPKTTNWVPFRQILRLISRLKERTAPSTVSLSQSRSTTHSWSLSHDITRMVRRNCTQLIVAGPYSFSLQLQWECKNQVPFFNKKFWEELIAYFPWYDTDCTENEGTNNSSIVACVVVTAVTFLPSGCLATIGGFLSNRAVA